MSLSLSESNYLGFGGAGFPFFLPPAEEIEDRLDSLPLLLTLLPLGLF
jgi:hypothetical protein